MEPGKRFEDLPVWQDAIRLGVAVFDLTGSDRLRRQGDLVNQLERASLSVSNNIAEGWGRGSSAELLTFLYYAKGSCGEVRSMLRFLSHRALPEAFQEIDDLLKLALNTSRQFGWWIESIKKQAGEGARSQNDRTRTAQAQALRQASFRDKVRDLQDRARQFSNEPDPSQ